MNRMAKSRHGVANYVVGTALVASLAGAVLTGCSDTRATSAATPDQNSATGHPSSMLAPYNPDLPAGTKPDLPKRIGIPGDFNVPVSVELATQMRASAESRGLTFTEAIANGDLVSFRSQAESMLTQGLGGWWVYAGYNSDDIEKQSRDKGIFTFGLESGVQSQMADDLYALGQDMATAAVKWADKSIHGQGEVVILAPPTTSPAVVQYKQGMKDVLAKHPGLHIVSEEQTPKSGGDAADTMATLLQAHPNINIVLGHSASIGPALSAFESLGRGNDPKVFMAANEVDSGLLAKIGHSIFRAGFANPWPLYGYAYGQYTADWLEGKSVPKLLTLANGRSLLLDTPAEARKYIADMKDAKSTWNDVKKRDSYIKAWGNVSYDTRSDYWHQALLSLHGVVPNR
ncbi:substrate-binding domain-containing protein [Microbacterium sp. X-17]|uniref:sugar ABC transporter substrate-binding protein n=1 Tax=Microbacterium sp. X-17 TaxID=3144404 RepID=UPI0031F49F7E